MFARISGRAGDTMTVERNVSVESGGNLGVATDTGSTAFSSSSMSLDMGDAGVFAV